MSEFKSNPFRPALYEWVPYIAIGMTVVLGILLVIVVVGAHGVEEQKCNERGGELVCPYKSRCMCIDRGAFR